PRSVKGEDAECHANDAGRLSVNEFHDGFCDANSLPCELRQEMHLRTMLHPVKSPDVQAINAVCSVEHQQAERKSHDSAMILFRKPQTLLPPSRPRHNPGAHRIGGRHLPGIPRIRRDSQWTGAIAALKNSTPYPLRALLQ